MTTLTNIYAAFQTAMGGMTPVTDSGAPAQYVEAQAFETMADSPRERVWFLELGRTGTDGQYQFHGDGGREDDFVRLDLYVQHINEGRAGPAYELSILADERRKIWQQCRDVVQTATGVGACIFEGGDLEQDDQEPSIYWSRFRFRVDYHDAIVSSV